MACAAGSVHGSLGMHVPTCIPFDAHVPGRVLGTYVRCPRKTRLGHPPVGRAKIPPHVWNVSPPCSQSRREGRGVRVGDSKEHAPSGCDVPGYGRTVVFESQYPCFSLFRHILPFLWLVRCLSTNRRVCRHCHSPHCHWWFSAGRGQAGRFSISPFIPTWRV